ncbi:MAG: ABC transporter ATP-binding protein [Butyricicoccus sp.]|jgi:putative ABC transport system ATP-binding protein|nr:ABC transporter ATP-binding protein [Clostridiales bacterium]
MSVLLECKDVFKTYQNGKLEVPALREINLEVQEGEYVAIMGPSGSGKTTLMNIIGCLDVLTSGTCLLDGENLANLTSNQMAGVRNRVLGFVFQQADLLPGLTALENVALPLLYRGVKKRERLEKAAEMLDKVGLSDRMTFRPNQLSGGQRQRVAIARAMVGKPKLLLADEPTGALDSKSGKQIMSLFRQLNDEGITIIMITHAQEIANEADRICYIFDGMLTEGKQEERSE